MIGTSLNDRFRLEEKIGSGGMSTVYRAFDPTLERWVAIKVMHRDMSEDPDSLERFRREARAVARLSHPHVVTVIDFGEDDGTPYIVLEYVEGETLKERIKRMGRLPVAEAVAYAIEIGRALQAAHSERLVHRDVKPQNVLIDSEGRGKVTDFGIARSLEAHGLTATGRVLGTTDYVSPEQALGKEVTEQSDVYSLGVVLYESLTGEVPFKAESQVGVAMQHVKEPLPDVQRRRPEVSASLAAVLEHATAKETANRYPSAQEMVHDLEEVLSIEVARSGETSGEATNVLRALPDDTAEFAPARLRNPRRWALTVLAVLLLVGGAVAYFATRTEKGTGTAAAPRAAGLTAVPLGGQAAQDYDPQGDDKESAEATRNAIDGNRTTNWDTESYEAELTALKEGVGLYVDAGSALKARRLDLTTATPGFTASVYAANEVPEDISGWSKVSEDAEITQDARIAVDTLDRSYRYYLLWITALGDNEKAEIQELTLRR
ncbi:MAG: protein kinase [Thermoleophilaceae bacterium]